MAQQRDDDLAAAWHDLMGLYHRTTCALDRELLARHDVTVSDFEVLQQLHAATRGDARVRMNELGDKVHLSQSALSRLITRLERDGLVERCMCEDDRRSVWVTITPAGAQRYKEAKPTQRSILRAQSVAAPGEQRAPDVPDARRGKRQSAS
jgi:DNA-binding MarR family transcriptional regulator